MLKEIRLYLKPIFSRSLEYLNMNKLLLLQLIVFIGTQLFSQTTDSLPTPVALIPDTSSKSTMPFTDHAYFDINVFELAIDEDKQLMRKEHFVKKENAKKTNSRHQIKAYAYDEISFHSYNDGFQTYVKKDEDYMLQSYLNYAIVRNGAKYGLVLSDYMLPAIYDTIATPYLIKGSAPMMIVGIKKEEQLLWGVIDSKGKELIPIAYNEIKVPIQADFSSNKAAATSLWTNEQADEALFGYSDGLYENDKILVKQNGKFGLFNAIGEAFAPILFDSIRYSDDLFFWSFEQDGKYVYLFIEEPKAWGVSSLQSSRQIKENMYATAYEFRVEQMPMPRRRYKVYYSNGESQQMSLDTLLKLLEKG